MSLPWQFWVALWFLVSLAAILSLELASGGRFKVVGPVLIYDIIRAGRRGRYFILRALYATGLLLLLLWVWAIWWGDNSTREFRAQEMAYLGETFFFTYATIQFFAVLLLTPGYVAGCIAEDKERRTLEFLLATDLGNREIVFGKMAARVGNLIMFLLTGMPVLSMIQFFGGIDPAVLLLTFAATGLTMLGLVGISIVQSVQRRRVRDAIIVTYLIAVAYVCVSCMLWAGTELARSFPQEPLAKVVLWLEPVLAPLMWGEPIHAITDVQQILVGSLPQGPLLLQVLSRFAAFHLAVFAGGTLYAVWQIRKIALRQAGGPTRKKSKRTKVLRRPRVYSLRPMLWKELWIEGSLRLGLLAYLLFNLLIVFCFVPLGIIVYFYVFEPTARMSWNDFQRWINVWIRWMNPILSTFMLIGIAVRAAGSVGSERDRDTLVSLLTTPFTSGQILGSKFWGAIASIRLLMYWLLVVWFIGIVTGAVSFLAAPLQVLAFVPPAIAAAAVGLYLSVACKTSLRALMLTLIAMLFGLGGHWIVGAMCCYVPSGLLNVRSGLQYILAFEAGATPPFLFALLPIHPEDSWFYENKFPEYVAVGIFGHLVWLAIGAGLMMAALDRFSHLSNRAGVVKPAHPAEEVGIIT